MLINSVDISKFSPYRSYNPLKKLLLNGLVFYFAHFIFFFSAGEDFINDGPFPITFTESLTSVQIPLNLIDDSVHEASEEFLASLSTEGSSSVVSLSPVAALVRILDNDGKNLPCMAPNFLGLKFS